MKGLPVATRAQRPCSQRRLVENVRRSTGGMFVQPLSQQPRNLFQRFAWRISGVVNQLFGSGDFARLRLIRGGFSGCDCDKREAACSKGPILSAKRTAQAALGKKGVPDSETIFCSSAHEFFDECFSVTLSNGGCGKNFSRQCQFLFPMETLLAKHSFGVGIQPQLAGPEPRPRRRRPQTGNLIPRQSGRY